MFLFQIENFLKHFSLNFYQNIVKLISPEFSG